MCNFTFISIPVITMNITFVLPPVSLSGGIRSTGMIAKGLLKRGHDVLCVCPARKKPSLRDQLRSLKKGKGWLHWQKRGQSHFDDIDIPLKVTDHPAPIVAPDVPDADIVVATWWETAEWVMQFPPSKGAKVYFIRHHEIHDYLPVERSRATYSFPMHKVTISGWLVDLMEKKYGDSNVSKVPNSVDINKYYAPIRGKQATPTVGMMYDTTYWKGCNISIKAFQIAAEKIPNLKMIAFGKRDPSPKLTLPPQTEYIRLPVQNTIKDIYARCDVWLCGSWSEGFHRPPLEAMACRCPVVSTRVGGPMDIIEDGINGYLVDPGDYEGLAERLVRVLNLAEEQWQRMSQAAYETVASYTWDDAAELCEEAFERAIQRYQDGSLSP